MPWAKLPMQSAQWMHWSNMDSALGPVSLLPNNQSLTRALFRSALKKAFQELHMDHHQLNTHSFKIGAATQA